MTLRAIGLALRRFLRTARDTAATVGQCMPVGRGGRLFALRPPRRRRDLPAGLPARHLHLVRELESAAERSAASARRHMRRWTQGHSHCDRPVVRALVVGDKTTFLDLVAALTRSPAYRVPADLAIDDILMIETPRAGRFTDTDTSVMVHAIVDRDRPGRPGGSSAAGSRRG